MSALALPAPVRSRAVPRHDAGRPARRGHLQLVGPGFTPVPTAPADQPADRAARLARTRPAVRLTARGRLVRSVLGLVLATGLSVAGGSLLGAAVGDSQSYSGPVERVSVGAGDTLWGIAASTGTDGRDVREVVDDILDLNGLSSGELTVGQQLVVPAG